MLLLSFVVDKLVILLASSKVVGIEVLSSSQELLLVGL